MIVCLFDIDGTLIESGGAGRAALVAAMQHVFGIPLNYALDLHGRTDRGIAAELLEGHGLENTEQNFGALIDSYLCQLPAMLQQRPGRVLPGVLRLLQRLHEHAEVTIGLLTGNVRRGAEIKLSHYELAEFFPAWLGGFGDLHDCRNRVAQQAKDDASRHLNRALEGEQIWVIGDTPRDVQCGRAIGANVAAVATGGFAVEQLAEQAPDLLLPSLEDSSPLLSALGY